MTVIAGERRGDEALDEGHDLLEGVLARTDRDHIGIVVLARQLGCRQVPDQRGPNACDLVRRDLLAVARPSEHHAEGIDTRALIGDDRLCRPDAEGRVVVDRIVADGAVVDDLVAARSEVLLQLGGELQTGMVGGDVDAHAQHSSLSRTAHGSMPAAAGFTPMRAFTQHPGRHTSYHGPRSVI